jgi:glycosyltransferase involved in cell wall biosynthesis
VVHLAPVLFGEEIGGAERYTLELARSMARRVPTTLLTFGAKSRQGSFADGLEVRVLRNWTNFGRLRFDPLNLSMLPQLMDADVIHCHQPETMIATVALLYARAVRKLIFSTHLGGAGYGIHRIIDTKTWYDGHLHISEYSRRAFGHETLPHASVISGAVDTARFRTDPHAERTGEILYVGRLLPHKGVNYLIEGLDSSTRLTIVRRGFRHERRFFAELQRLAQTKQVTFVLNATDSALLEAYQRASCIVLPSVHQTIYGDYHPLPELLGQTLLEGMACGLPAICTNVTSLPELVEEGVTGFVVPPNEPSALRDKIDWIRRHPGDAAAMGAAARKRVVECFNWEMVVDRCLQAYGTCRKPPIVSLN